MEGEHVFPFAKLLPVLGDIESLELHGLGIAMSSGGPVIPADGIGCVGRGDPVSVDISHEAVIVFHLQDEIATNRSEVLEFERESQVHRRALPEHVGLEVKRLADEQFEPLSRFKTRSVATGRPIGSIEVQGRPVSVVLPGEGGQFLADRLQRRCDGEVVIGENLLLILGAIADWNPQRCQYQWRKPLLQGPEKEAR